MFLGDIHKKDDSLWGSVASEPLYTDTVKQGDLIQIDPSRVSDWLYVVNGIGVGGYTFKLMWSRFSDHERSTYVNQPPFIWVNVA